MAFIVWKLFPAKVGCITAAEQAVFKARLITVSHHGQGRICQAERMEKSTLSQREKVQAHTEIQGNLFSLQGLNPSGTKGGLLY